MTVADASAVAAAVADAHRREWAFVLAATVRVTRDLDVAEECAQEAFAAALTDWRRTGIPARPGAWLTTAAKRRALNVLRHRVVEHRYLPLLVEDEILPGPGDLIDERPDAEIPDDRLRLIVDLLPPRAGPLGAGGPHPAADVRPLHRGGGPRVPRQRADHGGADHPGQEEDRGGPDPVPGAARRRTAGPGGRRPGGGAPAVHDRAHDADRGGPGAPRPGGAVGAAVPDAAAAPAERSGRGRPVGAAAAHRRPAGDPYDTRRSAAPARGAGPHAVGSPGHRRGRGPGAGGAARPAADAVRAAGRDRRRPRGVADVGRHRLDRDRRPVRRPDPALAVAGRRAQPRGGCRVRPRGRRRPRGPRRADGRAAARRVRLPARGAGGLPPPARPAGRGPAGLCGGPAAHREQGRTGVPRRPAGRAGPQGRRRLRCRSEPHYPPPVCGSSSSAWATSAGRRRPRA